MCFTSFVPSDARRSDESAALNKYQHLRELVYEKNQWDEPLSLADKAKGFLGWHERGYLPHCDRPGLVQLVTFRLQDSLPVSRRGEWEHLLTIEDAGERRLRLEEYLDRSVGKCWLQNPAIADLVETIICFHHQKQYELLAWCVMPNHVHSLVHIWDVPLSRVMQNWKSMIAVEANRVLGRNGSFWQREYWDTFMRDEAQERKATRYIENNPVKAKLCVAPEEWKFSSARFRDEYRRLVVPDKINL